MANQQNLNPLMGILWIMLCFSIVQVQAADDPPANSFTRVVLPYLKTHCWKCHNQEKHLGDLSLHELKGDFSAEFAVWMSIRERLEAREMPPEKEPQPAEDQTKVLLDWLKRNLNNE